MSQKVSLIKVYKKVSMLYTSSSMIDMNNYLIVVQLLLLIKS